MDVLAVQHGKTEIVPLTPSTDARACKNTTITVTFVVVITAGQWGGCVCSAAWPDEHQLVHRHAEDLCLLLVLCGHDLPFWPVT